MKINSIEVENALALRNLKIIFPEQEHQYFGKNLKISLLVGENGTGKTSILKLLSYAFFPKLREKKEMFQQVQIKYNIDGKDMELGGKRTTENIIRPRRVIVSSFAVFEAFKIDHIDQGKQFSFQEATLKNGSSEYFYCGPMRTSEGPTISSAIPSVLKAYYHTQDLKEKRGAISELFKVIGFKNKPSLLIDKSLLYMERDRLSVLNKLENVSSSLEAINYLYEKVSEFGVLIHPDQINDEFLAVISSLKEPTVLKDLIFQRGKNDVGLSQMSSGELSMFYRFFPIISNITQNSLVLIDEPETHLHPKWIQQYINLLVKLFQNYNSHIILASHSPMIASDLPNECIIGLYNTKNNGIKSYYLSESTLGGEPGELLKAVFGLEKYLGDFSSQKMKEIKILLEHKEYDLALKLYRELSNSTEKLRFFLEIESLLPKKEG